MRTVKELEGAQESTPYVSAWEIPIAADNLQVWKEHKVRSLIRLPPPNLHNVLLTICLGGD